MLPSLLRKMHEFSRRLVIRVMLIALLAVLAVGLAKLLSGLIPAEWDGMVGKDAVDHILSIIANSMLTVTTFSLTVMAAAHRNVSSQWTPRAHQMLLQDTTTHTVLATFVGAYLYALLAIILRDTGIFVHQGLAVLFGMTLLVVAMIVVAIIRWISHLEMLGSLIETSQRIEDQTAEAYEMRAKFPALGARILDLAQVPDSASDVRAHQTGYVQKIYQDLLQDAAEEADARIWLLRPVGGFVHKGQVLARVDSTDDDLIETVRRNVAIGTLRNFEQDPIFGLICLSEIAVRALSPGVNDPGTAIDMMRRITRVLMDVNVEIDSSGHEVLHDRLFVPALDRAALVLRPMEPILVDWNHRPEMQEPMHQTFDALSQHYDPEVAGAARKLRAETFND
ncbi:DUF2254 domain-containing protein [Pseudooceanicola sediminis]|uniref:DUF2254 domain-containing protein n=1 Tax=Pseudooceanicola sediminis TaxID=2211117 RepID=A0A399J8G0_9RHOB|nr:DUF2254 domain-containing protein [Pseudooceanicola sediminis]KAA2317160.1 DUF2254 domain-containing protein [Puniceibacterium sp. HSS470]RII40489.1 DUF2254 domain-containing protein [Pseudooceanicola sediminis]|tara:strand:+ start:81194 stop:82375 length:1182 start_codon:yes stop_codon:yes gene_type:complete